jgi:cytochrome c peroxidase
MTIRRFFSLARHPKEGAAAGTRGSAFRDARPRLSLSATICLSIAAAFGAGMVMSGGTQPQGRDLIVRAVDNMQPFPDSRGGEFRTFSTAGTIDTSNPFFQDLGANGRRCVTCHQPDDGWTITPAHVRRRFDATDGNDPIFRTNDGSVCAGADIGTLDARRQAFRLLLDKGLIRVGMPLPDGAEFTVDSVDDPYGCAPSSEVSMYRRPLPSTNVHFLSTVMWDGRETVKGHPTEEALLNQARDATMGHAQALTAPSEEQLRQIVAFETGLFTAQTKDPRAGSLTAKNALGGPIALSQQFFFPGINDPLGQNPTGAEFTSRIFSLFDAWDDVEDDPVTLEFPIGLERGRARLAEARRAIARGQEIFNTRPIMISDVHGLNDVLGQKVISGFCGTCHDSPNIGHHSVPAPLDLGLTDAERRTPDLPLYTLRNAATGELRQTSDPGRAMVTGKWADIGKFKGPILRGLSARAPYFHNGSAATLRDVVDFYNDRFQINLSDQEKSDLVAFLSSL